MIRERQASGKGPRLAGVLLLAAATTACWFPIGGVLPGGSSPSRPPLPSASVGAVLPVPFSEGLGAESLYGGGKGKAGIASWRPRRLWQVGGPKFEAKTEFSGWDLGFEPFEEAGSLRAWAVAAVGPPGNDCPTCTPVVGVLLVTETAAGWRVDGAEPELGTWGAKGELTGTLRLVKLADQGSSLMFHPVVEADGVKRTGLVLVNAVNGAPAEVLRLDDAGATNGGSCGERAGTVPCWGWDYSLSTRRIADRKVFDLVVTRRGKRLNEAKAVEEFSEATVYEWDGKRYAPKVGGDDEEG